MEFLSVDGTVQASQVAEDAIGTILPVGRLSTLNLMWADQKYFQLLDLLEMLISTCITIVRLLSDLIFYPAHLRGCHWTKVISTSLAIMMLNIMLLVFKTSNCHTTSRKKNCLDSMVLETAYALLKIAIKTTVTTMTVISLIRLGRCRTCGLWFVVIFHMIT